jgi:two-component sensor histidine kinase
MLSFGLRNLRFRKLTFLFYGLVSMFSAPSRLIQQDSSFIFFFVCLSIGALITLITFPMLWAICELNQRFKLGQRNVLYPLGLVLAVGAIRGAVLQQIIARFGLADNLQPILAILSSTIFTFIYFTLISSFMESVLQRRDNFNRVFAEASLLLVNPAATTGEKIDPREIYLSTLKRIKETISPFEIDREAVQPAALLAASQAIQSQINEVLRPLSHRLWINGMGQVKHRNILRILRDSIENLEFRTRDILAYQLFVGGYGISLVIGFESAVYVSAIGAATSFILMKAYRILYNRKGKGSLELGLYFLISVGLLPVFVPLAFRNPLNEFASAIAGLIISPTLPGLILLVSAYKLVIRDRDIAIGAASSVSWRIASLRSNEDLAENGIELAEYFHNSLQSELFGIAKRLEKMSKTGVSEAKKALAKSLDGALSRNYQDISAKELDGVMRIENLVTSWQGIAEIDISGLENLVENSSMASRASQILEEMITNSIRYGEADQITVELNLDAKSLQIALTHNGRGEISKKSGLGSLILAKHSDSGLRIESEEGKTYLRLSLPLR